MSRPKLAEKLGYTPQRIGQIESGGSPPSEDFAKDCDVFFKTDGTFHRLWQWIQDFGRLAVLPPGFPDFIEREREAEVIHIFETMVITGCSRRRSTRARCSSSGRRPTWWTS
ncbi:helix-turn-helix transcriptional regulator [Actinomadura sp. KC345]|uniref:helix-turn-helix domain-containing protein n=1 Tax=Actinomadura sp. KC345 TaxID=2530371 RepID=UPI001FB63722|nr:helix-turn-helix transcriptional regulator [Actinomadura sp. KC345]